MDGKPPLSLRSGKTGRPDSAVQWYGVSAAIAAISAVGAALGLGLPLLSVILESRGYSATMIGLNTAASGVAAIAAAPATAPLAGRFGVARTMIVMFLMAAASFAGFYVFDAFWIWIVLRMTLSTALTFLFVLSEYWINASAPPERRGLVFGIYGTVLSIGFAFGPWFFAQIGSEGFAPFGVGIAIILVAALPVLLAWRHSPEFHEEEKVSFLPYVFAVPTATAAVFVFGVVETGGFALFPLYGTGIGYSASNAALLLTMIGLGNVFLQLPVGVLSDRVSNRRNLLLACALVGLGGTMLMPFVATNWSIIAALLFIWGGVVAGLYTVGLLHLGTNLSGRQLASANAAFVFCYALGALVGPQVIGVGMDAFGPNGFPLTLGIFFGLYVLLVALRLIFSRKPARAA